MRRRERLDAYLDETGLDAVWFARPNSFAWLTGGDNVVDASGDVGVAAAGYGGDDLRVITNDIEAGRLANEELPDDARVESYPWHDADLAEAVAERSPTPAAADFDIPGFERVDASALRQPLTDADVDAYRDIGADAAEAVETVCRDVEPGTTEREAAAALREALARRDIRAPVVLVGGETRAPEYRHYTPQDVELGGYALLSVTGHRGGLAASLTRTVRFDAPDWFDERQAAASRVASTTLA
ncbi:M24 family metallopeptidase, partial [Halarchaeum acidiphilum]